MFIADFFEFVYGTVSEGPVGIVVCVVKALAFTMVFCLGSVAGVYVVITSAFVICCVTILPIILISVYWKGFWGDLGYTYKWIWISGLIIGGCISGLSFLPIWLGIALALVVLVLFILCAIVVGIAYLFYLICATCFICCSSCCEDIGDCCNDCNKYSSTSKPSVVPQPPDDLPPISNFTNKPSSAPQPPDGLPPIDKYTIIFDTTENDNLPPIDKNTIIFESTYNK